MNLTYRYLLQSVELYECTGIAGNGLLIALLHGKQFDSVLYSRIWFPEWNRRRAVRKLLKRVCIPYRRYKKYGYSWL